MINISPNLFQKDQSSLNWSSITSTGLQVGEENFFLVQGFSFVSI